MNNDLKNHFASSNNILYSRTQNKNKNLLKNKIYKKSTINSTNNSFHKSKSDENEVEMKFENEAKVKILDNEEKMDICNENEYNNTKLDNNLYHNNRCLSDHSNSTSCSNTEKDKKTSCVEKMENSSDNDNLENNINTFDSQIKDKKVSLNELKSNVEIVKEYMDDILENLIEEDENNRINLNPNYMNYQHEINVNMRAILIDWIIDVNGYFNFQQETLYKAIYIIDAYLSKKYIEKKNLQLLGTTSLLVASKLNEIYLRRISDYSDITQNNYDVQDILNMEQDILKVLNFNLLIPSPLSFYEIISQKVGISNDINKYKFGEFLMESFLLDYRLLNYSALTISTAICYIVMKFCKVDNYKIIFAGNLLDGKRKICGENNNEYLIKDCAKKICETITEIINSNFKSTIKKYSDNAFYNIIKNNYSIA